MSKILRVWTSAGVLAIATATGLQAAMPTAIKAFPPPSGSILVEGEGGEGGEGGGSAVTTYALNSTDANAFNFDAKPQIDAYADLVQKSYTEAKEQADNLSSSIDALLDAPSADTLSSARNAWVKARPAYLQTEAFRFYDGPIEAIEGEINAWPMNEAHIDYVEGKPDAGLVNAPSVTLFADQLQELNQKSDDADVTTGWHAIEFLLWGQDKSATAPGNRPYTDYASGTGNNDRRRTYLKVVTEKLVGDLQTLENAWAQGNADNYRAKFIGLEQREALGRMINGMAILAGFEFMSERLSVALDSGDQEDEHSCFSDTTKQDFVYDLNGIKRVWVKTQLSELVSARDDALARKITTLLDDTEAKIAKLGDPWDTVLASTKDSPERQAAEDVVGSLQALSDGLKEVGTKLGVLVIVPTG
jgi:putative iron-regulated protein